MLDDDRAQFVRDIVGFDVIAERMRVRLREVAGTKYDKHMDTALELLREIYLNGEDDLAALTVNKQDIRNFGSEFETNTMPVINYDAQVVPALFDNLFHKITYAEPEKDVNQVTALAFRNKLADLRAKIPSPVPG